MQISIGLEFRFPLSRDNKRQRAKLVADIGVFNRDAEGFANAGDQDVDARRRAELNLLNREIALRTEIDTFLIVIQADASEAYRQTCDRVEKLSVDVRQRLVGVGYVGDQVPEELLALHPAVNAACEDRDAFLGWSARDERRENTEWLARCRDRASALARHFGETRPAATDRQRAAS